MTSRTTTATAAPETTTCSAPLTDRARQAADAYRATDPDGFATRHANWARWTRRAATAHDLATALGVPPEHVAATDDPDRTYGIHGQYPGDRYRVHDPASGQTWDFLPDPTAHGDGHGWLLLGECVCEALLPVARVATLADLGTELQHPLEHRPPECDGDPAHQSGCPYGRHNTVKE